MFAPRCLMHTSRRRRPDTARYAGPVECMACRQSVYDIRHCQGCCSARCTWSAHVPEGVQICNGCCAGIQALQPGTPWIQSAAWCAKPTKWHPAAQPSPQGWPPFCRGGRGRLWHARRLLSPALRLPATCPFGMLLTCWTWRTCRQVGDIPFLQGLLRRAVMFVLHLEGLPSGEGSLNEICCMTAVFQTGSYAECN